MNKVCPSCGISNTKNARFCTSCGENLENVRTQNFGVTEGQGGTSACLWCNKNAGFQEEEGKLDSKWGVTAHRMKIFICRNCGYAHLFGLGRTIWDFD